MNDPESLGTLGVQCALCDAQSETVQVTGPCDQDGWMDPTSAALDEKLHVAGWMVRVGLKARYVCPDCHHVLMRWAGDHGWC